MNLHQFNFAIGLLFAVGIIAINSNTLKDRKDSRGGDNELPTERDIKIDDRESQQKKVYCIDQDMHNMKITIEKSISQLDNGRLQQIYKEKKKQRKAYPGSLPNPIAYGNANQSIQVNDKIVWTCWDAETNESLPTERDMKMDDRESQQKKVFCIDQDEHKMIITVEESSKWLDGGRLQKIYEEWKEQQEANPGSLPNPIAYGNAKQRIKVNENILWSCLDIVTRKWLYTVKLTIKDNRKFQQKEVSCIDQDKHKMNITVKKSSRWLDYGRLQQIYEEWKEQQKANPGSLPNPIAYGNANQRIQVNDKIVWTCWDAETNESLYIVKHTTEDHRECQHKEMVCIDQDKHKMTITIEESISQLDNGRLQQIYEEWKKEQKANPGSLPNPIAYENANQSIKVDDNILWTCRDAETKKWLPTERDMKKTTMNDENLNTKELPAQIR